MSVFTHRLPITVIAKLRTLIAIQSTSTKLTHQPLVSIFENLKVFILVRIGIPIVGILIFFMLTIVQSTGQMWYLMGAFILLVEVEPTFRRGKYYLSSRSTIVRQNALWVRVLRPIVKSFGLEDIWIRSFCQWNNHRVQQAFHNNKATRIILLLPHCVQAVHCKADIVKELTQCYRCGLCVIGKILPLQLESRCNIRIVNRSHKAYKEVQEYQPDLVIAVSCLDRLFKGITKLPLTPTYVIPLILNHGMCVNTKFNIAKLTEAMEILLT